MTKIQKQRCGLCGHIISKRQISLYSGMIKTLYQVFKWCEQKGIHEFKTAQVKHLFDLNSSARFGDLVYFGGIVYKTKKAHYGLNMQRCDQFFRGQYNIPEYVVKNPITGTVEQGPDITIGQVPHLSKFLNEDNEFQARYFKNTILPDCLACLDKDYMCAHKGRTKQHPI